MVAHKDIRHFISMMLILSWFLSLEHMRSKIGTGFRDGNPSRDSHAKNMQARKQHAGAKRNWDRREEVPDEGPNEGCQLTRWSATYPGRPVCPVPNPTRHPNEFFETKIILIGCRFRPISGSIFFRSSGDGPSVDSLSGSNQSEISTKFRRNFDDLPKFRVSRKSKGALLVACVPLV